MQIIIKQENLKAAQKLADKLNEKTISKAINRVLKEFDVDTLQALKKDCKEKKNALELIKKICEENDYGVKI